MAGPDYIVDIDGLREADAGGDASPPKGARARTPRPWLAIHWRCCQTYSRIYRNTDATAYEGRCPCCGSPVHVAIGAGGSSSRFFTTD